MPKGLRHRVNLFLDDEHHRLLKMLCAEQVLTLQQGATKLVVDGLFKMGQRAAAPTWLREPIAPLQKITPGPIDPLPAHVIGAKEYTIMRAPAVIEPEATPIAQTRPCATCGEKGTPADYQVCIGCGRVFDPDPSELVEEERGDMADWVDEEALAFNPETHYQEVLAKGLSARSALEDTKRAIEYYNLDDRYPSWQPGAAPVAAAPTSPAGGPISAKEFEVPGTWLDNAGHTRAQNLARFGEDESVEYWAP